MALEWPFGAKETVDVIAGGLGGASKWAYLKLPVIDGLISIAVGCVCAHFFSGIGDYIAGIVFAPFVQVGANANDLHVGQFIIGICGMSIVGFVIETVKAKFASNPPTKGKAP